MISASREIRGKWPYTPIFVSRLLCLKRGLINLLFGDRSPYFCPRILRRRYRGDWPVGCVEDFQHSIETPRRLTQPVEERILRAALELAENEQASAPVGLKAAIGIRGSHLSTRERRWATPTLEINVSAASLSALAKGAKDKAPGERFAPLESWSTRQFGLSQKVRGGSGASQTLLQ